MDKNTSMLMMMHVLTPTHAGSGTELSYVDLPIQREGHTGFPKIEASTLKGCIRYAVGDSGKADANNKETINRIFGKPDNGDYASAVSVTDARLLFFPVKSAIGIFAWITCPYAIRRFLDDYEIMSGGKLELKGSKENHKNFQPEEGSVYYAKGMKLSISLDIGEKKGTSKGTQVMLEDYTYEEKESEWFGALLEEIAKHLPEGNMMNDRFMEHTVVVDDNDFAYFVKHSTQVSPRIKIDPKTGTVDGTSLFTEEYLPPESVLYSILFFGKENQPQEDTKNEQGISHKTKSNDLEKPVDVKNMFKKIFNEDIFQVGGDHTLGKGLIKKRFWEVETDEKCGSQ